MTQDVCACPCRRLIANRGTSCPLSTPHTGALSLSAGGREEQSGGKTRRRGVKERKSLLEENRERARRGARVTHSDARAM